MEVLSKEHVRSVVNTIYSQLIHTTPMNVIISWGISKMNATQITKTVNGEELAMAALVMQVDGFCFKGKVYIALDEGADYYRIYGEQDGENKEYYHDVACEELGSVLDTMIETGGMSQQEYQTKVISYLMSQKK